MIGGQPAFVSYISPTQINAQVPSGVAPGARPVVVTTPRGTASALNVNVEAARPGVLAPASFKIGATQYAVALFPDNTTFVLPPGAIGGVPSRRALPGDTITLYGVSFGAVTPAVPAGQIAARRPALAAPLTITIGGAPASVAYNGLAPGFVGLFQFNAVVPTIAANDAVPLVFTLGGVAVSQSLALAVGTR